MAQLELKLRRVLDVEPEWHSGPYCVAGTPCIDIVKNGYTHMIRSPSDPERRSRKQRHSDMGIVAAASATMTSRKTLAPDVALEQVLQLLADGKPRTLNAICVELWDQTADIVDDRIWWAIVDAVAAGDLEHSIKAPILIRLVAKTG